LIFCLTAEHHSFIGRFSSRSNQSHVPENALLLHPPAGHLPDEWMYSTYPMLFAHPGKAIAVGNGIG